MTPVQEATKSVLTRLSIVIENCKQTNSNILTDDVSNRSDQNFDQSKTSLSHLLWMAQTAIEHLEKWPLDKTSRWVGFIQGCLVMKGLLDVDEERNYTRPLFHHAYKAMDQEVPQTMERS